MLKTLSIHVEFDWTVLWPLILVLAIGALVPVILSIFRLKFIPVFVVEIICGIIIVQIPAVRDLFITIEHGHMAFKEVPSVLYMLGMAILLFLSGLDTDFSVLRPQYKKEQKTLNSFGLSWMLIGAVIAISILLSFAFYRFYVPGKEVIGVVLMIITLSSTFASLVIPLVHNENLHNTTLGKIICTYSTIAEFLSIVSISTLLIINGAQDRPWLLVVVAVILLATYAIRKLVKINIFKDKMEGIVFLGIRFIILVLLGMIIITYQTGAEFILGSFLAGMVIKATKVSHKTSVILEAIGYGVFVPIFYILVGVNVGASMDFTNTTYYILIPVLFVALVLTKIPFVVLSKWYPAKTTIPTIFIVSSTIIVAIACEHFGAFTDEFANSLIIASALTCIIPPVIFALGGKIGTSRPKYDPIIIDPHDIVESSHSE